MSSHCDNTRSNGTVRYEFDSNGVLAVITEGIDGVRTHMKFIHDVSGISNVKQHPTNPTEDKHVQTGPAFNGNDLSAHAIVDDDSGRQTPKAQTRNGFHDPSESFVVPPTPETEHHAPELSGSFSTQTSGPFDAPTEIIQCDERGRQIPNDNAPAEPSSHVSHKAPSHLSGTTQPPPSLGHAEPHSLYYEYQEAGLPTFECESPENSRKAEAQLIIQRCDATNRKLGLSGIPNNLRFEICSSDGSARFDSPSPSAQTVPPSLSSRESTPIPAPGGSFRENVQQPPEFIFDCVRWQWLSDRLGVRAGNSMVSPSEVANSFVRQSSPFVQHNDSEMMGQNEETIATQEPAADRIRVSRFFSRDCSPLTEYDYSVMDVNEGAIEPAAGSRLVRQDNQLVTPKTSPVRGYLRTEPIITRKRAKKLEAALRA